ncbi:MAG TPA: CarD family transcriptional regulator [Gaiellaceae bacterium]
MIAEEEKPIDCPDVGDTVVYASHGIGRVVARERKPVGGSEDECIVVDLDAGLRVTLSLKDASERLRSVADERELEDVRRTLLAEPAPLTKQWTKRLGESKAKLASGRPVDLAELVRDGSRFEQARGEQLSHGERRLYLKARELLMREIASARGLGHDEAEAWIDEQLAVRGESED